MNITVENIKCGGCAGTITKKLNAEFNTDSVKVEVEQGMVTINIEDNKRDEVTKVLLGLGYPETDSVHGLSSAKAKAKSFVSCAIGKMDK
ncbi:heavy-metal-associated domain-containing protein [bacterium endosymbiont of Bathymodiolus sp. 5 South]|jgi:copper chaperone CopZ|uniref:heavy-metal-associated domain-containing protein n=1 Tax=bacterium endosymbiont of Bathymodiolus sp. 5 South TaxID=1181670 RepID=UPI000255FDF5|nr:heavy-metal-associated domain-containing protein [bacterium endosymbiont of Bathymodiolus sp. 5 South]CAC9471400.1 Heavy metal transport/detoxification protein [uncultured Gammaproteobacteria bacterium]CAC9633092.1 Heavy metal transport/detoxification protein [uncultured Gammaproteobacteria bacterium]CAC9633122.1 Heavy metal transport/detoxification protein [uncultured Gammaproteobacteria bacterium]SHN89292.1 Heavy metal transport/detoxification protein [bacterium endosymbiont of Bathymodiol